MKFGVTGRDITDKRKFMSNKKKSNFLERFKGRTVQMSTDGHIGIVKNTHSPIKPTHENTMKMYNNQNMSQMKSISKPFFLPKGGNSNTINAFSPMKRSNSLSEESPQINNNRYSTFKQNYNQVERAFGNGHKKLEHKRSLANAGGQIMSASTSSLHEYPKMHSSKSTVAEDTMKNSALSYKKEIYAPNSSKSNPSSFNDLRNPNNRSMGKDHLDSHKNSFNLSKTGSVQPCSKKEINAFKQKPRGPFPVKEFINSGNSNGFTSVSTPMNMKGKSSNTSKNLNYKNHKDQIDAELTILRRSIQNSRQSFSDLCQTHKPEHLNLTRKRNSIGFPGQDPQNTPFSSTMPQKIPYPNPRIPLQNQNST
ncbi:unnamed protein product [Moneuplotes crassus]|uniref:Uncharacterized protein n=1 Tax=Euplotes crassus TaxID=5936 RepID=A0AAD1UFD6_EUPCR|nr:unnamed protein product [Moneuplotes crassus]